MHRATRRISILLIAMFAFSGLAFAGTAGASTPATAARPAASCAAQVKKFSKISGLNAKDASNPANIGKVAGQVSDVFKALAKNAPASVKPSFNRLSKAYASLKGIKLTSAASAKKFASFSSNIGKDLSKVSAYFASNCSG